MQKPQTQRTGRSRQPKQLIHNIGVDPLHVMQSMRMHEKDHTFYCEGHVYLKFRRTVASWLMEIGDYFRIRRSTTYAAIYLLDRLMPDDRFKRFQWQLLAICCLTLCAKYYEREQDVPPLSKLEEITQDRLPSATVLTYEMWILTRVDWDVGTTCAQHFLDFYLAVGLFCEGELTADVKQVLMLDPYAPYAFIDKLAERCVIDYTMKPLPESMVAAAIVYLARERYGGLTSWPSKLVMLTGYTLADLETVIALVRELIDEPATPSAASTKSAASVQTTPVTKQAPVDRSSPRGVDELM